ncbi:hypothetical protein BN77_p10896 [Rhizobium mesoamericanum STM3625]|uniref:Uncharacterized protein n=1 Tax=Rhizobium mesoamericanum STM3625 TaxID=1211777 RepID=K0PNW2_9HYPH|nr:hypothetical protein BN77_p10896 [Rhizobium mesoamericanum STM3625]
MSSLHASIGTTSPSQTLAGLPADIARGLQDQQNGDQSDTDTRPPLVAPTAPASGRNIHIRNIPSFAIGDLPTFWVLASGPATELVISHSH